MIDWSRAINGLVGAALAMVGALAVLLEALGIASAVHILDRWLS